MQPHAPRLSAAKKLATIAVTAIALGPLVWAGVLGEPMWIPLPLRHLWTFSHLFTIKPETWTSYHVQLQGADGSWHEVAQGPPFGHETFGRMTRLDLLGMYMTEQPPNDESARQRELILDKLMRGLREAHVNSDFTAAPALERPAKSIRLVAYRRTSSLDPPKSVWSKQLPGPVRAPHAIVVRKLAINDPGLAEKSRQGESQ